ncbi:MAG: AtpZ/AtpI family protein [Alphaproteobacteria bacterium]|jgi:ATP synthase protein I|nr:AtpZ/AtpI family protein [Alphaproteobacteria bacterium]
MSEHAPEPEDLRTLGDRIDALRQQESRHAKRQAPSAGEIGLRFATELVSAVIVGAAIGWGLDWLFSTRPILTIVFFVVGAGAGIINVNRASKEITERTAAAARAAEENKEP